MGCWAVGLGDRNVPPPLGCWEGLGDRNVPPPLGCWEVGLGDRNVPPPLGCWEGLGDRNVPPPLGCWEGLGDRNVRPPLGCGGWPWRSGLDLHRRNVRMQPPWRGAHHYGFRQTGGVRLKGMPQGIGQQFMEVGRPPIVQKPERPGRRFRVLNGGHVRKSTLARWQRSGNHGCRGCQCEDGGSALDEGFLDPPLVLDWHVQPSEARMPETAEKMEETMQ